MTQLKVLVPVPPPDLAWVECSTVTLRNARVTRSVGWASTPARPLSIEVTRASSSVIVKNSSGVAAPPCTA